MLQLCQFDACGNRIQAHGHLREFNESSSDLPFMLLEGLFYLVTFDHNVMNGG